MLENSMDALWQSSHIAGGNATYVEDLYESYLKDPNGVPAGWRDYFDKLPLVESGNGVRAQAGPGGATHLGLSAAWSSEGQP